MNYFTIVNGCGNMAVWKSSKTKVLLNMCSFLQIQSHLAIVSECYSCTCGVPKRKETSTNSSREAAAATITTVIINGTLHVCWGWNREGMKWDAVAFITTIKSATICSCTQIEAAHLLSSIFLQTFWFTTHMAWKTCLHIHAHIHLPPRREHER